MARVHRLTHPHLGVISWDDLKKQRPYRVCSWCFGGLKGGQRTRCGKQECVERIQAIISWANCAHRVLRRDKFICTRCGDPADQVDHIIPVSLGGTGDNFNLRSLCGNCHKSETARLRREGKDFVASLSIQGPDKTPHKS